MAIKTHASRRLGLLPKHLCKHLLQPRLKLLVLAPLVKLAHKMPTWPKGIACKL